VIPTGVQEFVALERWSFDRLAGAALERIGYDVRTGALFIYFGKRKDAAKILFADGARNLPVLQAFGPPSVRRTGGTCAGCSACRAQRMFARWWR
jgi:hypothetical protein